MRAAAVGVLFLAASHAFAADLPSAPSGVVADGASLFSAGDRAKLEAVGADLLRQQAVALRVVTLADARGEAPKAIAVRALNTWRVGQKSVLLLIVMNPRALYLQPGTALASSFDAAISSQICSTIVAPQMRAKAYGAAALAGLGAIRDRLTGFQGRAAVAPARPARPVAAPVDARAYPGPDLSGPIVALLVLTFPAYWIGARVFARRCPSCRTRMTKTSRVLWDASADSSGRGERAYLCSGCGHTETETYTFGGGSGDTGSSSSSSDGGSSSDGSGGGGSDW